MFLDKYRIEKLISDKGGFGLVFEAHHPDLQENCALKLFLPIPGMSNEHLLQLRKESQKMARLRQHKNIVQELDAGIASLHALEMLGKLYEEGGGTLAAVAGSRRSSHRRSTRLCPTCGTAKAGGPTSAADPREDSRRGYDPQHRNGGLTCCVGSMGGTRISERAVHRAGGTRDSRS